jgi:hypothetical protein
MIILCVKMLLNLIILLMMNIQFQKAKNINNNMTDHIKF